MSKHDNSENADRARSMILDALDRAHKAANQHDHAVMQASARGHDPTNTPAVQEKRIQLHSAVMDAWRRLQADIKDQYPEYWDEAEVYKDDSGRQITGLEALRVFQGATNRQTVTERVRHKGRVEKTHVEPVLLPPEAAKRALELLEECANKLGYSPTPQKRRTVHALGQDGTGVDPDNEDDDNNEGGDGGE